MTNVGDHKYLACVDTDAKTGDVTVHVLNEQDTAKLNAGAEYIENLLGDPFLSRVP